MIRGKNDKNKNKQDKSTILRFLKMIRIKLNMRLKEDIPHDEIHHGKGNTPGDNAREDRPRRLALLVVIIHNTATSKLSISTGNPTRCLR